jgi:hypothetical protein
MNNDLPTYNSERIEGLAWLRNVLTSALEVCPLSYQQKKKTTRFLSRMPDWLMAKWAEALNIDFVGGCSMYPDMADKAKSDTGKNLAQQYLEAHDAVPVANILDELVKTVVKKANESKLPVDSETVESHVCAMALAGCTTEGIGFGERASDILSYAESPNHSLVNYHMALANGDNEKIEALDATLTGGRYGSWVADRFNEMKRWLSGGAELNIHWEIETLRDNGGIYQFLLKGGKKNES